jgi:hypothetical protein
MSIDMLSKECAAFEFSELRKGGSSRHGEKRKTVSKWVFVGYERIRKKGKDG